MVLLKTYNSEYRCIYCCCLHCFIATVIVQITVDDDVGAILDFIVTGIYDDIFNLNATFSVDINFYVFVTINVTVIDIY